MSNQQLAIFLGKYFDELTNISNNIWRDSDKKIPESDVLIHICKENCQLDNFLTKLRYDIKALI